MLYILCYAMLGETLINFYCIVLYCTIVFVSSFIYTFLLFLFDNYYLID